MDYALVMPPKAAATSLRLRVLMQAGSTAKQPALEVSVSGGTLAAKFIGIALGGEIFGSGLGPLETPHGIALVGRCESCFDLYCGYYDAVVSRGPESVTWEIRSVAYVPKVELASQSWEIQSLGRVVFDLDSYDREVALARASYHEFMLPE